MKKATACKVCGATPYHGTYCRDCWRERESKLRYGQDHEYKPYQKFVNNMPCPDCGKPIADKHRNFIACRACGKKRHRRYQKAMRELRREKRTANNPIIVAPKSHRAKGQKMAPPAPKIEVRLEKVIVPEGMEVKRVILNISRFEEGRQTIWD